MARTKIEIKPALALSDKLHANVGALDGVVLGSKDGSKDGPWDGASDGPVDSLRVGAGVGGNVGTAVGGCDWTIDGLAEGFSVGLSVGPFVGLLEGATVRIVVGLLDPTSVGAPVALLVGAAVGAAVEIATSAEDHTYMSLRLRKKGPTQHGEQAMAKLQFFNMFTAIKFMEKINTKTTTERLTWRLGGSATWVWGWHTHIDLKYVENRRQSIFCEFLLRINLGPQSSSMMCCSIDRLSSIKCQKYEQPEFHHCYKVESNGNSTCRLSILPLSGIIVISPPVEL
jgi:hypothetical protein